MFWCFGVLVCLVCFGVFWCVWCVLVCSGVFGVVWCFGICLRARRIRYPGSHLEQGKLTPDLTQQALELHQRALHAASSLVPGGGKGKLGRSSSWHAFELPHLPHLKRAPSLHSRDGGGAGSDSAMSPRAGDAVHGAAAALRDSIDHLAHVEHDISYSHALMSEVRRFGSSGRIDGAEREEDHHLASFTAQRKKDEE